MPRRSGAVQRVAYALERGRRPLALAVRQQRHARSARSPALGAFSFPAFGFQHSTFIRVRAPEEEGVHAEALADDGALSIASPIAGIWHSVEAL